MSWNSGDVVDGWTLKQRLGKGGNAVVWRAVRDGEEAALKLLLPEFLDPSCKRFQRFKDEACKQKELAPKHPGVLPLLNSFVPDAPSPGRPVWLATPLATPITDELKERPLEDVVGAVLAIAKTLAGLHTEGVSHRDVKPSNLYWYQSRWVVGDLGLVDFPDKESITETGEKLGPMNFLAPEMLREGKRADGDPADVYCLAKTLWVLASGQRVPPPGELRLDNPQVGLIGYVTHPQVRQLDSLIERSTRHDPPSRPSMSMFSSELQAWTTPGTVAPLPDVSELLLRFRQLSEPNQKAGLDRAQQVADGKNLVTKFQNLMRPIAQTFKETGVADGQILHVGGSIAAFRDWTRPNTPASFWSAAIKTRAFVPKPPSPSQQRDLALNLDCLVEIKLLVDGNTQLRGCFTIEHVGKPEMIAAKEYMASSGSAELDKSVVDLFSHLNGALTQAMSRFLELLGN